jgi:4-hydroxy-tetrahydrodipicolinate reductase
VKIALLGYGKMGRAVEQLALSSGIQVPCVIDPASGSRGQLREANVAIDFSEPCAVISNIRMVADAGLQMVVGTTGWYDRIEEARQIVQQCHIGLVYGSNFSLGVNLMFMIVRQAARLFSLFDSYDPFIEEAHHKFKKDAPSGTALSLKRIIESEYDRQVPTVSLRAGYIPGMHTVGFDSESDALTITHLARDRTGFARGALIAAQWILDKKGFYEFPQAIEEMISRRQR